jgi:hypothetical protein
MQIKRQDLFTTVRTEGAILPPDLLQCVAAEDAGIEGLTARDYHLSGEKLNGAVNRSWNKLTGAWAAFKSAREKLPAADAGTSVTRERWLLPLFQELGYGRVPAAKAVELEGKTYAVSHRWQNTPMHLVGFRADLDRRAAGIAGAARSSAHSHLQEYLNRASESLWGFVSNGLRLRILRDNKSLTRQSFVEFDLEAMMDGQVYPDFKLLWLVCHQSRVETQPEAPPDACWLEKWSQTAIKQGTRALDQLRSGVEQAITALGRGFLAHSANSALRQKLTGGTLAAQDYYRQLLRMVYRLMFLFVAEDRGLLFAPSSDPAARDAYTRFYSTWRLRELAGKLRGTPHTDLYAGLSLVFSKLDRTGCPELALPALGSFLWSEDAVADLLGCALANRDLLAAIGELAYTQDGGARRPVDYKNLGPEELGGIYESLLELHPRLNTDAGLFELSTAAGHERKTTGSYYTPTSLVNCLLDSALDPVLDEAAKRPDAARAILDLKVCDPACGSGHFLIAAAHRIAKRLAAMRTGDEEPAPDVYRHALRDVIGHCIYGVDMNPMAVELCKVSLWMEALEPGKPLSFLDSHIQTGNALLGATPALLDQPLPDDALKEIEGDDSARAREYRKRNKDERQGQEHLFDQPRFVNLADLAATLAELERNEQETAEQVHTLEQRYSEHLRGSYEAAKFFADAWCAAFVWPKNSQTDDALTHAKLGAIRTKGEHCLVPWMREKVRELARQYRFFHWHIAFPHVFGPRGEAGFDVVLGNPPWERIKLQEKEWFAERRPDIANATNAAQRRRMIAELASTDPALHGAFLDECRRAEGESHFVRVSGRYPLCGRGDVNTYALFAELNRSILSGVGRVGCIVPSGIAMDDTTKFFFRDLMDTGSLESLYDFENAEAIFPTVHRSYKFSLLTLRRRSDGVGGARSPATFVFFAHDTSHVHDPNRRLGLSADAIALFNPNTRTCPVFRSRRDAEVTKAIYERVPVLMIESPEVQNAWGVKFLTMFHMAGDSGSFRTRRQLESEGCKLAGNSFRGEGRTYLPLYEAKMTNLFDHRHGNIVGSENLAELSGIPAEGTTYEQHRDPSFQAMPRYWVEESLVSEAVRRAGWTRGYFISFRDLARSTDVRTAIHAMLPLVGVGHKAPLLLPFNATPVQMACLLGNLNSYVLDYCVRQKIGGASLSFFIVKQVPVLPPTTYDRPSPWDSSPVTLGGWLLPRVLELTYTALDLSAFAADCGYSGPPFVWDDERRFLIRCELDAAFFHLYGVARGDVAYILDTFPIVERKDRDKYGGTYRTKETLIEIFDAMAEAIQDRTTYQSRLNPLPADPRVTHPAREVARPAPVLVQKGMLVGYITLLLHAWKGRPVSRQVLELGLIFMFHDEARNDVLGKRGSNQPPARFQPLDSVLSGMEQFGSAVLSTVNGKSTVSLGDHATPLAKFKDEDLQRAIDAVAAVEKLGVSRAMSYVQEKLNVTTTFAAAGADAD